MRMIVVPEAGVNLYAELLAKERTLRESNRGTLHYAGKFKDGSQKWVHTSHKGWIRFQKSLGRILVATVFTRSEGNEWQILQSFVGFLHRHFSASISSITINFDSAGEESE